VATSSLRPLSIGEILDAGIKVVVRHWKPLMGCIVGLTAPVWILYVLVIASVDSEFLEADSQFSTSSSSTGGDVSSTEIVGFGISFLLLFVTFLIAFTACFKVVSDAWLGSEPSIGRSLRFGLRRSPMVALLALIAGIGIGIGFALCLLPGIWLSVLWCLAFPALLFERTGPFKAMGRSSSLIKGRWWASLLLVVVGYLLVTILGGIIQYGLLAVAAVAAGDSVIVNAIATVVGSTLSSAITYPYLAAVLTILYFDQRVRKEGFDLQLLAEGMGAERDPDAPLPEPLIGDDKYTPEQRAAAPYWPPPPGWVPPPSQPEPSQWASSSGWSAPSSDREPESPLWGTSGSTPPPTSGDPPRRDDDDDAPPTYPSRPSGDEPPPTYPTRPSEPEDPLPPPPADEKDSDAKPKPDSGRADWLPPEAPRGPGGL
jgi:hypothetical protein